MSGEVKLDTSELDKILKRFKGKVPAVKVGILGENTIRDNPDDPTNAEIGAKHEFGQAGMPVRSFLRMPIEQDLARELSKLDLSEVDPQDMADKIGVGAMAVIEKAFDSGGDGQWPPSKKDEGKTLVDTGQLRESISYEVLS